MRNCKTLFEESCKFLETAKKECQKSCYFYYSLTYASTQYLQHLIHSYYGYVHQSSLITEKRFIEYNLDKT